jgi:hypothetical protein
MEHDPDAEASAEPAATDEVDEDEASYVAAYDLDGDGKVGPIEDARATLGLIDAQLEEIAEEGGVKGAIADAAHHIVDRLDND